MVSEAAERLSNVLFLDDARRRDESGAEVGVVIPFWQRQPTLLRAAVESVCAQRTAIAIEIVIVDDGSPITARSELRDLIPPSNVSIRLMERPNGGVAAARNTALDYVIDRVNYVAFLDSDDTWEPDHLRRMMSAFAQGADFYFTDYIRPDEAKSSFEQNSRERLSQDARLPSTDGVFWLQDDFLEIILRNSPIGLSTVGYRTANARFVRFSGDFQRACEDRYFFAELSRHMGPVAFSTRRDVIYGVGTNLFKAARFGSSAGAERIRDSARFHTRLVAQFPLKPSQRVWNNQALISLDHQFIETVCSYFLNERALRFEIIKSYIKNRPSVLWRVLPDLFRLCFRKLRKAVTRCDEAHRER
jgi:succinoglycan biosynthesis protein ExoW